MSFHKRRRHVAVGEATADTIVAEQRNVINEGHMSGKSETRVRVQNLAHAQALKLLCGQTWQPRHAYT